MSRHLRRLQAAAWISPLDRHFAEGMGRIGGEARPEVLLAAALASRHVGAGHVCLDLAGVEADLEASGVRLDLALPPHEEWLELLRHSPIVCDMAGGSMSARKPTPLVLDSAGRLYLHRHWRLQEDLARHLRSRAADRMDSVDVPLLQAGLDRYFKSIDPAQHAEEGGAEEAARGGSDPAAREPDRQRIAAALSVMQRFSVISGGPGTGKTSTVARILALIVEQALAAGEGAPTLTLVAPTGKAAATLADSIRRVALELDCEPRIKDAIPAEAATIHRCLGLGSGRARAPRHHAGNLLATDLVLVDEASMVDLVLMSRLIEAVPPRARLILLGDEHQLASVEAGAILGDICNSGASPGYSRDFAVRLSEATGEALGEAIDPEVEADEPGPMIRDCIARLTLSHRHAPGSGIAALSRAIRNGDAERALEVIESEDFADVSRGDLGPAGSLSLPLRKEIVSGYGGLLRESDPLLLLESLSSFRLLAAHHRGPGGVEELNRLTQALLHAEGLVVRGPAGASPACPIMIKRNDYEVGLFNGDVGILSDSAGEGMRAYFDNGEGGYRSFSPNRLPAHLPAFAVTIHKSQGSEFDRVNVILPNEGSAALSRELLYTAVTRARTGVRVYGTRDAIELAIRHRIDRSSGLGELLWSERGVQGPEPL